MRPARADASPRVRSHGFEAFSAPSTARVAGAPGIHFYALNKAPATRAVLGALRASKPWERTRGDASALAGRIS